MSGSEPNARAADGEYFDEFAARYQEILDANLAIAGETGVAFTRRRMAYLRRWLPILPARVMDFGCGIGLAIPFLLDAFPGCQVIGVDVSPESVRLGRERCRDERPRVSLTSELDAGDVDLVYTSGVFHPIPPGQRPGASGFIPSALRPRDVAAV